MGIHLLDTKRKIANFFSVVGDFTAKKRKLTGNVRAELGLRCWVGLGGDVRLFGS